MVHSRKEALETAVTSCIRDTFQTEEARNKLSQACESLSLTDEAFQTILSDLTQMIVSNALEQITQWSQENDMPRKWDTIDRFAIVAPAMAATMNENIALPGNTIPHLKLTEQLVAQKQKELDKLQQIASQRHTTLTVINRQIDEQENRTQNLTNNIDNSFRQCAERLESCARAFN